MNDRPAAWTAALRRRGLPLVFTVHDLRNPHHRNRGAHDAALDVLVPAADALITLPPGAAVEIRRRWGREALVLPQFHVIHNHSLSPVPITRAHTIPAPMLTALHTPLTGRLRDAVTGTRAPGSFVAVSGDTATAWSRVLRGGWVPHVSNGVDVLRWQPPGYEPHPTAAGVTGRHHAVWSGRIVPEKAPHDAIDAARTARTPLVLAGPVVDAEYHTTEVVPRLGRGARFLGHLPQEELRRWVASADVAVVSPAWEGPFGLVAAEALACGTPMAGYARGGRPEFVTPAVGVLVPGGGVGALGMAMRRAARLSRAAASPGRRWHDRPLRAPRRQRASRARPAAGAERRRASRGRGHRSVLAPSPPGLAR
ncbi:glycosyltransferase [Nocardioides yefusunii]|uniref:Glycosyltransferase n=1 Tax=Nocardioides yefusunii TaxID=2500546 RepID=A0ABW1QUE3_9ACTN|nr:glycosyltransferase [Nocardioides yefusunii]